MFQKVDDRSLEHKFIPQVRDFEQKLAIGVEILFDVGVGGDHSAIMLLTHKITRFWRKKGFLGALPSLKIEKTMGVVLVGDSHDTESVPAQVLMVVESIRMLARDRGAITLTACRVWKLCVG